MTTVSPDPVHVESRLASGTLRCPTCRDARLAPWGWARDVEARLLDDDGHATLVNRVPEVHAWLSEHL